MIGDIFDVDVPPALHDWPLHGKGLAHSPYFSRAGPSGETEVAVGVSVVPG